MPTDFGFRRTELLSTRVDLGGGACSGWGDNGVNFALIKEVLECDDSPCALLLSIEELNGGEMSAKPKNKMRLQINLIPMFVSIHSKGIAKFRCDGDKMSDTNFLQSWDLDLDDVSTQTL